MRVLGAQSLRVISELHLPNLGPENAARAVWRIHPLQDPKFAEN